MNAAAGTPIRVSDFNTIYEELDSVRQLHGLAVFSALVATGELVTSSTAKDLRTKLEQTALESPFLSTVSYDLGDIEPGAVTLFPTVQLALQAVEAMAAACVNYAHNSSDRTGYCSDRSAHKSNNANDCADKSNNVNCATDFSAKAHQSNYTNCSNYSNCGDCSSNNSGNAYSPGTCSSNNTNNANNSGAVCADNGCNANYANYASNKSGDNGNYSNKSSNRTSHNGSDNSGYQGICSSDWLSDFYSNKTTNYTGDKSNYSNKSSNYSDCSDYANKSDVPGVVK